MSNLTEAEEKQKRAIYEKMNPRRRKYVDKVGYDQWDPFQKPNDPIDIRQDPTKRTTRQLVREFFQGRSFEGWSTPYAAGVWDIALGIIAEQDKFKGMYDFSVWYHNLKKKEGLE